MSFIASVTESLVITGDFFVCAVEAHNTQEKKLMDPILDALERLAHSDRQPPAYRTVWDTFPDRSTILFPEVPGASPFDGLTVATWER